MLKEEKISIKERIKGMSLAEWVILGFIFVLIILFCTVASAQMYAGETYTYETDIKEVYWIIEGNSSNMDGLNISYNDGKIILGFAINFQPDNFTITFYDNSTKEEIVTYDKKKGSSGGFIVTNPPLKKDNSSGPSNNNTNETISPPEEQERTFDMTKIMLLVIAFIVIVFFIVFIIVSKRSAINIPDGKMGEDYDVKLDFERRFEDE